MIVSVLFTDLRNHQNCVLMAEGVKEINRQPLRNNESFRLNSRVKEKREGRERETKIDKMEIEREKRTHESVKKKRESRRMQKG